MRRACSVLRPTGLVAGLLMLASCATAPAATEAPVRIGDTSAADAAAARLAALVEGPWTSAALAARDPTYLDIRSVNVRIWRANPDMSGAWFYTESARPSAPTVPYRQNVFHLVAQEDGTIHAYQYRVREPARFAGAALRNEPPETLKLEDLVPLPGCTLIWRVAGPDRFEGAMRPRQCRNTFRGATWMDGSSWVSATQFHTWDRGMSEDGRQVWGPEKAGYTFERAPR